MIPKFNTEGYLPNGIHKARLKEIEQKFGSGSAKRRELFKGLQSLVQLLRKHKGSIKRFLLNGSYVTCMDSPRDFDCILIVKKDFDFSGAVGKKLRAAKKLFNAHLFAFIEEDVARYHRLIDFFGHDRDEKPKGLVEVIL